VTVRDPEAKKKKSDTSNESKTDDEDLKEVVFIFEADTARMAIVKTGVQDHEFIEILEGVQDSDLVVTGPYSTISRKLEAGDALTKKEKKKDEDWLSIFNCRRHVLIFKSRLVY
jgi:HlyD family secretion protein